MLLDGGGEPPAPDATFARFHGLYWLLADLASDDPLLVVVDDAHWADDPSIAWLSYLATRLDGLAVGVLVTTRPAEANDRATLLRLADPPASRCRLAPLSPHAVTARLAGASSIPVDPQFSVAFSGAGAGVVRFDDLSFVKAIDTASPRLLEATATGHLIERVTVVLFRPEPATSRRVTCSARCWSPGWTSTPMREVASPSSRCR